MFSSSFTNNQRENLAKYVAFAAVPLLELLFVEYRVSLKIVSARNSKHGDFRAYPDGRTEITVNNTLNKYQFLLTLVHEIAHLVTQKEYGRVKPHGLEWKVNFQKLMLPFLIPEIYPRDIIPYLVHYLKDPKASTDTDVRLSLALRNFKSKEGTVFVFQVPVGEVFLFRNVAYKKGNLLRKRYECLNLSNKKVYLFNQNAEVILKR